MTNRDIRLVPELPHNSDIKLSVLCELHFYTGKDELENWMARACMPSNLVFLFVCTTEQIMECSTGMAHRMCMFFCNKNHHTHDWRCYRGFLILRITFCKVNHNLCFVQNVCIALLFVFSKVCAKGDRFVSEVNFKMTQLDYFGIWQGPHIYITSAIM
jgi:hypothetical protein